jgi:hypothetical protein
VSEATVSESSAGLLSKRGRSDLLAFKKPCRTLVAIELSIDGWNGNKVSTASSRARYCAMEILRCPTPSRSATSLTVIADQLVGLAFVLRGCGGNYRCGNSEISTCNRRNCAAAEGRFDAIRSPGEQPSEKLGV